MSSRQLVARDRQCNAAESKHIYVSWPVLLNALDHLDWHMMLVVCKASFAVLKLHCVVGASLPLPWFVPGSSSSHCGHTYIHNACCTLILTGNKLLLPELWDLLSRLPRVLRCPRDVIKLLEDRHRSMAWQHLECVWWSVHEDVIHERDHHDRLSKCSCDLHCCTACSYLQLQQCILHVGWYSEISLVIHICNSTTKYYSNWIRNKSTSNYQQLLLSH